MTPAQPTEPQYDMETWFRSWIMNQTFHDFVECTISSHVLDDLDLKHIPAIFFIEEFMHVVSFIGITNGATNSVAMLEELFGDMTSDVPIDACDQHEGSFRDCWHGF